MPPKPAKKPAKSARRMSSRSSAGKSGSHSSTRGVARNQDPLRRILQEHEKADRERHQRQVEEIQAKALESSRVLLETGYTRAMALEEAEAARLAAMCRFPVDASSAVAAVTLKARLMGLIVDKQAVLHGSVGGSSVILGDPKENRLQVIEQMREALGSEVTKEVLALLTDMRVIKPGDENQGNE